MRHLVTPPAIFFLKNIQISAILLHNPRHIPSTSVLPCMSQLHELSGCLQAALGEILPKLKRSCQFCVPLLRADLGRAYELPTAFFVLSLEVDLYISVVAQSDSVDFAESVAGFGGRHSLKILEREYFSLRKLAEIGNVLNASQHKQPLVREYKIILLLQKYGIRDFNAFQDLSVRLALDELD